MWNGEAVFPPCYLTWGQTMVEVMTIKLTSFKRSNASTATLNAPDPAAGHGWPTPPSETPGHSQASLGQFLAGSLLFFLGPSMHSFICALPESVSPVLCTYILMALWWVNGDLLQEGLCHAQLSCTQNPCPHSSPLLTHTLRRHSHTILSQSLGSLGPGVHKVSLSPLSISGGYGVWF